MNRRQQLKQYFKDKIGDLTIIEPLIDEMVDLEEHISYLKSLPRHIVHPKNKNVVKEASHFKLLREESQMYRETVRTLQSFIRGTEEKEDSPLRAYLNRLNNDS
jgi:hypothetical protein